MSDKIRQIKRRLGPLWWYSLCMFGVSRLGDIVSLFIGAFLVPAVVSRERLGAILPLTQLAAFVALPLSIVLGVALKYMGVFIARGEEGKLKSLLRDLLVLTSVLSACAVAYIGFSAAFLQERLKVEDPRILWLVVGMGIISCWTPVATTMAQGFRRFYRLIASALVGPLVRLVVILLLLKQFQLVGFLTAAMCSRLAVLGMMLTVLWHRRGGTAVHESYRSHWREMLHYGAPFGVALAVYTLQLTVEPFIIRQRLPEADSAGYYIAAMFGNISMYVSGAMLPFLFPIVSASYERGESTRKLHRQALAFVLLAGCALAVVFLLCGDYILTWHSAWRGYRSFAPFIWQVAFVVTGNTLIQCHMMHENACRRFAYLGYYVPIVLVEVGLLYGLMGWPFFKPWLPSSLWAWVNGFIVRDLRFIMGFMLAARLLTVCGIVLDVLLRPRGNASRPRPSGQDPVIRAGCRKGAAAA